MTHLDSLRLFSWRQHSDAEVRTFLERYHQVTPNGHRDPIQYEQSSAVMLMKLGLKLSKWTAEDFTYFGIVKASVYADLYSDAEWAAFFKSASYAETIYFLVAYSCAVREHISNANEAFFSASKRTSLPLWLQSTHEARQKLAKQILKACKALETPPPYEWIDQLWRAALLDIEPIDEKYARLQIPLFAKGATS